MAGPLNGGRVRAEAPPGSGPRPHRARRAAASARGSGIIAHRAFQHWDPPLKKENRERGRGARAEEMERRGHRARC